MTEMQTTIPNSFHSQASIGDLSWLIYRWRLETNPEMNTNWKSIDEIKTSHGFDGRVFVNEQSKQIAITFEGTQADNKGGNTWLSKDGLADLGIGLKIIPTQMREGYTWFKDTVAKLQSTYGKDYGIVIAGHSLGGGTAQLLSGMYFFDTGIALPTLAEAGPGMLTQLKEYATEQLLLGKTIHLPNGQTASLQGDPIKRVEEVISIVNSIHGEDFKNVINLITTGDPVGNIGYNADPSKDNHIGNSIITPYILTPREDMQDASYEKNKDKMSTSSATPTLPGPLSDFSNINISRIDRHQPEQSDALWSGTIPGLLKDNPTSSYDYNPPIKVWSGSKLAVPTDTIIGNDNDEVLRANDKGSLIITHGGNHIIYGGAGGDIISGGSGNNTIYAGPGDSYIYGGSGNNTIYGGSGNDIIYGGSGNNTIYGGTGDSLLFGGTGNDTLEWTGGNDILCGQEGNDTFILGNNPAMTAHGNVSLKWERNFTNFGNDKVALGSNISKSGDSNILFNFADEIRISDMKFGQNGNDIILQDSKAPDSVTFVDGFHSLAQYSDMIDFKFTNGRLYKDDQLYHVHAGTGKIDEVNDVKYSGNILIGSNDDDIINIGKGNDVLFGGAGNDIFNFDSTFGKDLLVGSTKDDIIKFNILFSLEDFSIHNNGSDLVIDYLAKNTGSTGELTINNWGNSDNAVNRFTFADNSCYKIENNQFVKI